MKNISTNNTFNINAIWKIAVSAIFLIIVIRPVIMGEGAFHKVEGKIVSSFQGNPEYYIALNTSKEYYSIGGRNDILREKASVGENAIIWYRREFRYRGVGKSGFTIVKMIVSDEVIVPFSKGVNVVLVCLFGLLLIAFVIPLVRTSTYVSMNKKMKNKI